MYLIGFETACCFCFLLRCMLKIYIRGHVEFQLLVNMLIRFWKNDFEMDNLSFLLI